MDGTRWAVLFTRHAVPALVELHESFLRGEIDCQNVQRADIHAHGATLIGNAFRLIHNDWGLATGKRNSHLRISNKLVCERSTLLAEESEHAGVDMPHAHHCRFQR